MQELYFYGKTCIISHWTHITINYYHISAWDAWVTYFMDAKIIYDSSAPFRPQVTAISPRKAYSFCCSYESCKSFFLVLFPFISFCLCICNNHRDCFLNEPQDNCHPWNQFPISIMKVVRYIDADCKLYLLTIMQLLQVLVWPHRR